MTKFSKFFKLFYFSFYFNDFFDFKLIVRSTSFDKTFLIP